MRCICYHIRRTEYTSFGRAIYDLSHSSRLHLVKYVHHVCASQVDTAFAFLLNVDLKCAWAPIGAQERQKGQGGFNRFWSGKVASLPRPSEFGVCRGGNGQNNAARFKTPRRGFPLLHYMLLHYTTEDETCSLAKTIESKKRVTMKRMFLFQVPRWEK